MSTLHLVGQEMKIIFLGQEMKLRSQYPFIDSRIIRKKVCESMLSTNAEVAPITVAVVNQTALQALCFFSSNKLAHHTQARPWSLVSILGLLDDV